MALEDLIGTLYGLNLEMPLKYGQQTMQANQPLFGYITGQAQNATSLGNTLQNNAGSMGQTYANQAGSIGNNAMNLYGSLANTQAGMYQAELPFQMEQQKYNSLSPVLGGLLSYGGMGDFNIAPISMNYDRPDVMRGYQGTVDRAYKGVDDAVNRGYAENNSAYNTAQRGMQNYDQRFFGAHRKMMKSLPRPPQPKRPAAPQPIMGAVKSNIGAAGGLNVMPGMPY